MTKNNVLAMTGDERLARVPPFMSLRGAEGDEAIPWRGMEKLDSLIKYG